MLALVFYTFTLAPLVGLWRLERGAFGLDIGHFGYPNGATRAYATYLLVMYLGSFLIFRGTSLLRRPRPVNPSRWSAVSRQGFARLAWTALAINAAYFLFLFFVAGASRVVLEGLNRGEFRASLGGWGVLTYFARDFLCPMLVALVAFAFRRCPAGRYEALLLLLNLALAGASAAAWGYRAAAVFTLIPGFLLLLPRLPLLIGALLVAVGLANAVATDMVFHGRAFSDSTAAVLNRATTGSANSAFEVWDVAQEPNACFPPYSPTLLQVFGGRLGTALGVSAPREAVADYPSLLTLVVQRYGRIDAATSNVTGTVFAEGLLALGVPGYLAFAALAGLVVGTNRLILEAAILQHRPVAAVSAAVYFGTSVLPWLNTGGVVTLFLLPFLVSYAVTAVLAWLLLELCLTRMSPEGPESSANTER